MGKKHYKGRPSLNQGFIYNQSEELNIMTYRYHFQNLYSLALNRIKWINLPDGCNTRFLEETLLLNGQAVIFKKPRLFGDDMFFSTRVIASGPLNVYNNPTRLRSVGNNGWNLKIPWDNGVVVWETEDRYFSTLQHISIFANRLMDADRVADVNLNTMKRPFILTGPEEKYQEMVNLYRNINSNEPAIIGLPHLTDININVLQTGAEYLGDKMQYRKQYLMNEFLTFLGIDNAGIEKQERMTSDEVERIQSQTMIRRMNYLKPRRDALKVLKKRYPDKFKYTQVIWNTDNITPTWNVEHNLQKALDLDYIGEEDPNGELEDRYDSTYGIGGEFRN